MSVRRTVLLLTAALLAGLLPPAPEAAAATCLPAGGVAIPAAAPADADFSVLGRGWGHGAGMSQYGAYGAALLGCDAPTIVQTYYPGVQVAAAPTLPESFRVSLWPDRPGAAGGGPVQRIRVVAHTGELAWKTPDGSLTQPNKAKWIIEAAGGGPVRIIDEAVPETPVWEGGADGTVVRVPIDGKIAQLSSKSTNTQWADGRPYAHGTFEFRSTGNGVALVVQIDTANGVNALERYLRGLSEMPSSWDSAALQAQAITGRSYALDRWESYNGGRAGCACDVYDSVYDQAYSGYLKESEGENAVFGKRWVEAVNATAGRTMRYEGATATGYYSSSHGGHSESSRFVFGGGSIPYLQPVDDSRWETALRDSGSRGKNPNLAWTTGLSKQQVAAALDQAGLGVGEVRAIGLPEPKGAMGRVGRPDLGFGGVHITGSTGTRTVSGDRFRSLLGLRSTLFTIVPRDTAPPPPPEEPCAPTDATQPENVTRVSGAERIATSVAVSERNWTEASDVLLATARDYPDALASGSLSATLAAPLLLTDPAGLPSAVRDELDRLGTRTVWILGGERAVGAEVESALHEDGYEVRRVAGGNRFETARMIARSPQPATRETVALVWDQDWPAAVAAGALAASAERIPTLLTHQNELPGVTRDTLEELGTRTVLVIGGPAAISDAVAQELRDLGYTVERLAGADRYATSRIVADNAMARSPQVTKPVVLATGQDFPDALAAGGLAAHLSGALVLAPPCSLSQAEPVRDFLEDRRAELERAVIVGGTKAVSDRVREEVGEALDAG